MRYVINDCLGSASPLGTHLPSIAAVMYCRRPYVVIRNTTYLHKSATNCDDHPDTSCNSAATQDGADDGAVPACQYLPCQQQQNGGKAPKRSCSNCFCWRLSQHEQALQGRLRGCRQCLMTCAAGAAALRALHAPCHLVTCCGHTPPSEHQPLL